MLRHVDLRLLSMAVAVLLIGSCTSDTGVVDHLTIVNGTAYDLEVRATSSGSDGWVLLGRVKRDERKTIEQVTDLGDAWIFRFEFAGNVIGGELSVDRDDLVEDKWRIVVPERIGAHLRSKGIEPSPGD